MGDHNYGAVRACCVMLSGVAALKNCTATGRCALQPAHISAWLPGVSGHSRTMPPCSPFIAQSVSSDEFNIASLCCSSPSSIMGPASCPTFSHRAAPPSAINPIKTTPVAYSPFVQPAYSVVVGPSDRGTAANFEHDSVVVPSTLRAASESPSNSVRRPVSRCTSDASASCTERADVIRIACPKDTSTASRHVKKRLRFDTQNIEYIVDLPLSRSPSPKSEGEKTIVSPSAFLDLSNHLSPPTSTSALTSSTLPSTMGSAHESCDKKTWWTRAELQSFKESAKRTSRKVRSRSAFTTCLDVAYQTAISPPSSLSPSSSVTSLESSSGEEDALELPRASTSELRDLLQRGLAKWSTHGHSCRGLERRSSKYQFETRGRDIASARKAVLDAQEAQPLQPSSKRRKVSLDHTDASLICAQGEDEFSRPPSSLAVVSMERTERARLFARMMGQADAAAVGRK